MEDKEYENTYETIRKVFEELNRSGIRAYMVGGISVAIQAQTDLYRKNEDLDLMVSINQLQQLIESLKSLGYTVEDRRKNNTRNFTDKDGMFHAIDHELNASIDSLNMLGIGIFTYKESDGQVILSSYSYNEEEQLCVGRKTVMPKELFDLMYSSEEIEYKGTKVRTQSKEFLYLKKSAGNRDKDKLDTKIIESVLDEDSQRKIARIRKLQKRVEEYRVVYDENGNIESFEKLPSIEEKVEQFITRFVSDHEGLSDDEIKRLLLSDETVQAVTRRDEDLRVIIDKLMEIKTNNNLAEVARKITHDYIFSDEIVDNSKDER